MRACGVCAMIRVRVWRRVRVSCLCAGTPHFSFASFFALLAAAPAAVLCLYHTVPQALKRFTLWQARYNSSRTASLCGPLRTMRVLTWHMRVCCVCYDTCECVWMFAGLCI